MVIFNKLVRDKIPEYLCHKGKKATYEIIEDEKKYNGFLKQKLQEEVTEFLQDDSLEELADILEVIYALVESKEHSIKDLENCRIKKLEERGGFKKRIFLFEVK